MRSSVNAMASDRPPTIALAMDAVPCGLLVPWPGAYHSQTILSLRMTSSAFVFRSATLSLGYSIAAQEARIRSAEAEQARLDVEVASLSSPTRIA